MFHLSFSRIALSIALAFLSTSACFSQTFYGSVLGVVTDSTGAAVPDARVSLQNSGTQDTRSVQSDPNGSFQFLNLVPGIYDLVIEKEGFKRQTRIGMQVQVQAALRADAVLEVGEINQTVAVTGEVALLQTEQASLSQAIEGRTVQEMPLNGRNVMNLVALVPGVVAQGSTSGSPMANQSGNGGTTAYVNPAGWGNYQIGGGMANQSATYYDGSPINVPYVNASTIVPTQDAVQEFRVVTNNVNPEFGRFAGGVINFTTKSGTNSIHGTLYEYFRNRQLNANNFFNNRNGIVTPKFNQNQYGVEVAGPVRKEKTFFMGSWEGFNLRIGLPTTATVPTADMRAGNFSAPGIPAIYDPTTVCGVPGNNSGCPVVNGVVQYVRQPFSGNIIPASRIDPTAKITNRYWALPNRPGLLNNFAANGNAGGDHYQINTRVDHTINSNQRLFARYTYWEGTSISTNLFNNTVVATPVTKFDTVSAVIGYNWTVTPTTVADVHASYLRFIYGWFPPSTGSDLSIYGPAYAVLQKQMTYTQFPNVAINGMQGFSTINVRSDTNNYILSESVTRIAGRHTMKIGGESRRIDNGHGETNQPSGSFTFTTGFTALNALSPAGSGYAAASYLLGYPSAGLTQEIVIARQQSWYHGLYAQDTFQASKRLTLSYGLRWDYPGQFGEAHNAASVFLPTTPDPLGAKVGLPLMGPVVSVKSSLYPNATIHPARWKLFAPRFGFAYRADERTVIRSGYGISFLPNDTLFADGPWSTPSVRVITTMIATTNGGITPNATLSNPFPAGLSLPPGHSEDVESPILGSNPQIGVPAVPTPYVQQWNFAVQRELPGGTALEVGYAGSKGTHLPIGIPINGTSGNQIADSYLSLGNQLVNQVPNPFFGKVPVTAGILTAATISQGQLLRPYPQYSDTSITSNYEGDSTYHGLQAKVEKSFGHGGRLLGAYTWAKLLTNTDSASSFVDSGTGGYQDWNNRALEKSLVSSNVAHHLVVSYVYDLPFGKGQAFGQHLPGLASAIVSGWVISGTSNFQTGFPIALTAQPTTLNTTFGGGAPRPNVIAGCNTQISGSAQSRLNQWFNKACYTQPGPFAYGNEPRTDPLLTSQGIANWDVALARTTSIKERYKLRFETEFFNIANRVQFSAPTAQLGNPSFGIVASTRNQPRLVQFAMRLTF